jgi:hypothetical protein
MPGDVGFGSVHRTAMASEFHLRRQLQFANEDNPDNPISMKQAMVIVRTAVAVVDKLLGDAPLKRTNSETSGPYVVIVDRDVRHAFADFNHCTAPVLRLRGGTGVVEYDSDEGLSADGDPDERLAPVLAAELPASGTTQVAGNVQHLRSQVVPISSVPSSFTDLLRKQLVKVVKPPTADKWSDSDPDTYLLDMDRFVDISGAPGNDLNLLRVVWLTLPEHVRTAVATPDVSAAYIVAGPWAGLDVFADWSSLRAAIVAHFRPLAQDKHLQALLHLQMRKGTARKFRELFLHHLSRLESAYRPSNDLLLRTLQGAQYARLARMPNVVLCEGRTRWLPDSWQSLLNAMIDSDDALADDSGPPAPGGGSAGPAADGGSGGGGGTDTPKSRRRRRRDAKRGQASGAPSAGTGLGVVTTPTKVRSTKPVGKPSDRRWVFSNPVVVARQKAGECLSCGSKAHRKDSCPAPQPKSWYAGSMQKNA